MTLALPLVRRNPFAGVAARLDPRSEQAASDREREAALANVRTFASHAWIQTPEGDATRFAALAWPWQLALLALWRTTRLCVVLKARQLGVSWLAAMYALWVAIRRPGQTVLLISKGQADADKFLAKVAFIYERLPAWRPVAIVNTRTITFPGLGSEIEALPASRNVGRSRTANLVVLDEHAHQPNAHQILLAIKAVAEKGQIISLSSANGQGALHSQLFLGAKAGEPLASTQLPDGSPLPLRVSRGRGPNGWRAVFVPASAHPDRQRPGWREQARAELEQLSDGDFAQEYPEDDVEAIQLTGRPVFRAEDLTRQGTEPGVIVEPGLVIYREPVLDGRYIVAGDPAEGLASSDWSSASVVRIWGDDERYRGEQVAVLRGRWAPEVFAEKLDRLARRYGALASPANRTPVVLAWERNNHGHAVRVRLEQLWKPGAPYVLYRGRDHRLGWLSTEEARTLLVDQLAASLRTDALALHDAGTLDQCATFQENERGRAEAAEGSHDDDVIAIGLAWLLRRRAHGRVLGAPEAKAA